MAYVAHHLGLREWAQEGHKGSQKGHKRDTRGLNAMHLGVFKGAYICLKQMGLSQECDSHEFGPLKGVTITNRKFS